MKTLKNRIMENSVMENGVMENGVMENQNISEAREVEYRVAVLDVKDRDNLPCTITMKVPADCAKNFEKWLEDNQDDLFAHAEGGNVEY